MKIVYSWLSQYIKTDLEISKIAEILTDIGLEVEGIERTGERFTADTVLVGLVESVNPHPNADRLRIATVDVGQKEKLSIVCGAPNLGVGQKVPVATIGTVLTDVQGNSFTIKKSKLRGESSFGMICSQTELGLGEDNSGIWVLNQNLEVGKPLAEQIKTPDNEAVIEIGLTPNRADAMSHFGVARDLAAALSVRKIPYTWTKEEIPTFESEEESPIHVEVLDKEGAPRYAGRYLRNITVKPSPDWMQKQLLSLGISPKNNVVDITNYVLHDLGQPLHAFDADKINGEAVVVRQPEKNRAFVTLDEKNRELSEQDVMICDAETEMCIAGVFGGLHSGVSDNTQHIFLESAYFNPIRIRKTAKRHGLNTDASFRFERGIDPNITVDALNVATHLLIKYADAEVVGPVFDHYPTPVEDVVLIFRYSQLDKIAGAKIHRAQVKQILEALDIQIISENNDNLELRIPAYRVDVTREIDVIEEVMRIYGFNQIAAPTKQSFTITPKDAHLEKFQLEKTTALYLASLGFNEVLNNSLVNQSWHEPLQKGHAEVQMLNPLSQELSTKRQSLLPGLLENAKFNHNRGTNGLRIFEFGKTYLRYKDRFHEEKMLSLLLTGNQPGNWISPNRETTFWDAKGVCTTLLERIGIPEWEEMPLESSYLEGISGVSRNVEVFCVGKLLPKAAAAFDVPFPAFYVEIFWDRLLALRNENNLRFQEIPKFPESRRDLALVVPNGISYQEIKQNLLEHKLDLLKEVDLFDVYTGDNLPNGTKSYALSLVFRDDKKTVTDQQIDPLIKKILGQLNKNLNIQLRN